MKLLLDKLLKTSRPSEAGSDESLPVIQMQILLAEAKNRDVNGYYKAGLAIAIKNCDALEVDDFKFLLAGTAIYESEELLLRLIERERFNDIRLLIDEFPSFYLRFRKHDLSSQNLSKLHALFERQADQTRFVDLTNASHMWSESGDLALAILCAGEAMKQAQMFFDTSINAEAPSILDGDADNTCRNSKEDAREDYGSALFRYAKTVHDLGANVHHRFNVESFHRAFLRCALAKYERSLKLGTTEVELHLYGIINCHALLGNYFQSGFLLSYLQVLHSFKTRCGSTPRESLINRIRRSFKKRAHWNNDSLTLLKEKISLSKAEGRKEDEIAYYGEALAIALKHCDAFEVENLKFVLAGPYQSKMEKLLLKLIQGNRFSDIQELVTDLPQVHWLFECYKSLYWDTSHWDELSQHFLIGLKEIFESKETTAKSELVDDFTKAAELFSANGGFGFSLLCAGEAMVQSGFEFKKLVHSKAEMRSNDEKIQKHADEKIRKYVSITHYYARTLQEFGSVSPYKGKSLTFQKSFLVCAIAKYEQVLKMNSQISAVHPQTVLRDIICCHVMLGQYIRAGFIDLYERFYVELALGRCFVLKMYWVSFFGLILGLATNWKGVDMPWSFECFALSVTQLAAALSALVSLFEFGKLPNYRNCTKFVWAALLMATIAFCLSLRIALGLRPGIAFMDLLLADFVCICSLIVVTFEVRKNSYYGPNWKA